MIGMWWLPSTSQSGWITNGKLELSAAKETDKKAAARPSAAVWHTAHS
jgi:hypothetical protein